MRTSYERREDRRQRDKYMASDNAKLDIIVTVVLRA